jgi:hypothetical protein
MHSFLIKKMQAKILPFLANLDVVTALLVYYF